MTACIGGPGWNVHKTQSPVSTATSQSSERGGGGGGCGGKDRLTRLGRLADGRVATAPPGGGWNPLSKDMGIGTEITAASDASL